MMTLAGCDLGGTTTRIAIRVDGTDTIRKFPTEVNGGTELVDHLIRTISTTAHSAGISPSDIDGIGIGMPGTVDTDQRRVRLAANLGIGNVPLDLGGQLAQQWHLLTAGAFLTMAIPLLVFLALQRYFVRGMMAGSVKG
jgi:predicted NBD/HSP70 family sugar kinase